MTVRRTPQAEALIRLRAATAEASNALLDADPTTGWPDRLINARTELKAANERAEAVGLDK